MDVTAQARADQVRGNLERTRWVSRILRAQEHQVIINIAGFYLITQLNGKFVWTTEVTTGKPYHKTIVFTDQIRYVEFSPTRTIPGHLTQ
jgi:murein L,D-transpeptidase YcbB/YkuD